MPSRRLVCLVLFRFISTEVQGWPFTITLWRIIYYFLFLRECELIAGFTIYPFSEFDFESSQFYVRTRTFYGKTAPSINVGLMTDARRRLPPSNDERFRVSVMAGLPDVRRSCLVPRGNLWQRCMFLVCSLAFL